MTSDERESIIVYANAAVVAVAVAMVTRSLHDGRGPLGGTGLSVSPWGRGAGACHDDRMALVSRLTDVIIVGEFR